MTDDRDRFTTVLVRELQTLYRTRTVWLLAGGFLVLIVGTALLSGTSGYVPLSLSLLTPLELLVPAFAATLGYRAVLADRERNEISILRTYPIEPGTYILGVYCGRLIGLLTIIVSTLLITGLVVPLVGPSPAELTRTSGLDSPIYYLRFIVLTSIFAAVMQAIMIFLSAIVRNVRRGLILAFVAVITLAIGFDLMIILGLAGDVFTANSLTGFLAMSPASAYRGLVMTFVVAPVATTAVKAATPLAGLVGLFCWFLFPLLIAGWQVWNPSTYSAETE
ncbi:ABC transporter permease [halophilic archaeon]|nr:ABC transporter permease [halophilic archaeon]